MSILDRFFRKRGDPTQSWKPSSQPIPDFDVARMQFGSLRFGDRLESAVFLGRPDRFAWKRGDDYCQLFYGSRGFQIDFDKGRFAYLGFFIGPDECLPKPDAVTFSEPRLCGHVPQDTRLSRDANRATIERLLGAPTSVDAEDSTETILFYERQGVTMELELDGATGRLKRWNLYAKSWAAAE